MRTARLLAVAASTVAAFSAAVHAQNAATRGASDELKEVESVNVPEVGPLSVRRVVGGLEHPWGVAFLPDGRMLVTERAGRLRIVTVDGEITDAIEGTPTVFAQGQGGLLDVAVDPNFAENRRIYLSYAKPGDGATATTALGRGTLTEDDKIEGFADIFVEKPYVEGPNHFGNRIVFDGPDTIYLTLGERFQFDPAQDLSSHLGSIVRIRPDGSAPDDNPFVDRDGARPEIYSYGHRNIQAAAMRPETGELWVAEMGPLGGDELNKIEKGANYGWPVVSWGVDYDGSPRPEPPTRPEFEDAAHHWSPVISPSGMTFYTGDVFAAWKGRAIIGGLSAHDLVVVKFDGSEFAGEQRVPLPDRVRDVEQGPDGFLYVLSDKPEGDVWQVRPLK